MPGDPRTGKAPAELTPGRRFPFTRDSTADADVIRGWDLDSRGLNYGVHAAGSGLVIFDEDRRGAVDEWAAHHGITLPPTFTVATGRGRHMYFLAEGAEFSQRDPWPGANVRYRGYVVGAGSVHAETGAVYTVTDDRAPVPLPAKAVQVLTAPAEPANEPTHPVAAVTDEDARYAVDIYARNLRDLEALMSLSEGDRDYRGHGWDSGTMHYAARGWELVNAAGGRITAEQFQADFMRLMPGEYAAQGRRKLAAARSRVGDRRAAAPAPPESVFADLGPDDSTPAQQEDAHERTRRRYPLKNLRALLDPNRPPRPWIVENFWPAEASVSLIAPAGIGKSLFALSLACAVARGDTEFAGLPISGRRRVLYLDWENGEYDYIERLTALGFTQENVGVLDGWFMPLELPDSLPKLDTAEGRRELALLIDAYGLQRHDLVVLDSAQRMVGGPENDSDTWRAFYDHTALMLKARGMSVLRMDNTGHQDANRSRGSSSKRDDVDVQWVIKVPKNAAPGTFDFMATKGRMKDGLPLLTFYRRTVDGTLRWETDRSPRGHHTDAARRWLDEHGAAAEWGQDRAWEFAKEHDCPHPRALVREAQQRRKADAQAAMDDFDEVPE